MADCGNSFSSLSTASRTCFGCVNIIIGLVSLTGNSFVFYIFYKHQSLRNRSTYCLLSLAMTDLLVGAVLEPIYVIQIFVEVARTNCMLIMARRFISALLLGSSMSSIALISYDRYVHLSKTLDYTLHMSKRKIRLLIVVCWVLPGLSPLLLRAASDPGVFSGVIFVYTLLMLIIITMSYFMILRIVKRKEGQVNNKSRQSGTEFRANNGRNAVRVSRAVAFVILCFVSFNAPISVYLGIVAYGAISGEGLTWMTANQRDVFYLAVLTVSMANSMINAPIYYFRVPGFREKINRHLGVFCRDSNNRSSSSNVIEIKVLTH